MLPFNCINTRPGGEVINNHKYFASIHRYSVFKKYFQLFHTINLHTLRGNHVQVITPSPILPLVDSLPHLKLKLIILLFITLLAGSSAESDACILNGEIDIIYASTETVINDAQWRNGIKKVESLSHCNR